MDLPAIPVPPADSDRRRLRGARTRQEILELARDLASAEGLEGLTIGRLAAALKISKSGLFAHFGSKEDLQLAVVDSASRLFAGEVIEPARAWPHGLPRLWAFVEFWLAYVQRSTLRGGCFFQAALAEFDSRPGVVRDRLLALNASWRDGLAGEVKHAIERGECQPDTDPDQVSFELSAFAEQANRWLVLYHDRRSVERAMAACRRCVGQTLTARGKRSLAGVKVSPS